MSRRIVVAAVLGWTALVCHRPMSAAEREKEFAATAASNAPRDTSVLSDPQRRKSLVDVPEQKTGPGQNPASKADLQSIFDILNAMQKDLGRVEYVLSNRVQTLERAPRPSPKFETGQYHPRIAPPANTQGWFLIDNQRTVWQSLTVNGSEWSVPPGQSYIPVAYGVVSARLTYFDNGPTEWNNWRWNDRQARFEIATVIR